MKNHKNININIVRRTWLETPDESVFLERALIVLDAKKKYSSSSPGLRQGKVLSELCNRITPVVNPHDVFLGRIHEQVPNPREEDLIKKHPELFISEGVPGILDSSNIYIPDWGKLLKSGIAGLIDEVREHEKQTRGTGDASRSRRDYLHGVCLSLESVSRLMNRYAERARQLAGRTDDRQAASRLRTAAANCRALTEAPPSTFTQALQLFIFYHMVLSCIIGGRNITPGRMDQYLLPLYRHDINKGTLKKNEATELLAVMMICISQLTGKIATDFQSNKRTPNRFSHFYITLAGLNKDGTGGVNELSFAFLKARQLVDWREPSLCIRYFEGIDRKFWRQAVGLMLSRKPVLVYNDQTVLKAHSRSGMSTRSAHNYAHCGCLNCFIPGETLPVVRVDHNMPRYLLSALNNGKRLRSFKGVMEALRQQIRAGLLQQAKSPSRYLRRYPLLVWPLFEDHLTKGYRYWETSTKYIDHHGAGIATVVDSLLALRDVVFERKRMTMTEFMSVCKKNFSGHPGILQYIERRVPSYGSDEPVVTEMIERMGNMWADEVEKASPRRENMLFRPGFHSWLYNMEMGRFIGATPDGRLAGEPISSDHLPVSGRKRAPTETLNAMAYLPHYRTCSGGTTYPISRNLFKGHSGAGLLEALIESYFKQGGVEVHFIFADAALLEDAVKNPQKHRDLLVRVTGFSEYFVRLLPEVQQEIIRRERGV
jgi:trans-4-hydroxy-L-proline dehydratase